MYALLHSLKFQLFCAALFIVSPPVLAKGDPDSAVNYLDNPNQACPEYSSPEIKRHFNNAFKLVEENGLPKYLIPALFNIPRAIGHCLPANLHQIPPISFELHRHRKPQKLEPTRAFDQLSYVGTQEVGVWALETSQGIVLFDSMHNSGDVKNIIEPGLRKLGLNPKNVKFIVITHGHVDHAGGAKYLQDKYGSTVIVGRGDAEIIADPTQIPPGYETPTLPSNIEEIDDGYILSVGNTAIALYLTPGHTAGTLSAIFPVTHNGEPHQVAIYGGYGLPPFVSENSKSPDDIINVLEAYITPGLQEYIGSVRRLREIGNAAGVDVALSTHPIADNTTENIKLMLAGNASSNPWILGRDNWLRYIDVIIEMASAFKLILEEHPFRSHSEPSEKQKLE